jgi:GMP synthase-like glutamine amidotransferase
MKVHFLQHVAFEGLGSIETWLNQRQWELTSTRFFLNETLPDVEGLDFIIAGPGPMSVNDEAELPWLKVEKEFLRKAMSRGTPVLGICLGAQLIASSLGARVYPNRQKEIGWFPLYSVPAPADCFKFPADCKVFHWHGETFDLPKTASRIARSAACENQGFQIGSNVIGLQFHLESTPSSVENLIENSRHEMVPGPFVQSEAEIKSVPMADYATIHALMDRVLEYLLGSGSGK